MGHHPRARCWCIVLMLWPAEHATVSAHLNSSITLYAAIRARHITAKPALHYNVYMKSLVLRLQHGETLSMFAVCVQTAMQHICAHCPATMRIEELEDKLICINVVRVLSDNTLCKVLVSTLLHNEDKVSNITKLKDTLQNKDMSRNMTPELYGLRKTINGVLFASNTPQPACDMWPHLAAAASTSRFTLWNATQPVQGQYNFRDSRAAPSLSATLCPTCGFCKGMHLEDVCMHKKIDTVEKQLAAISPTRNTVHAAHAVGEDNNQDAFDDAGEFAGTATASPSAPLQSPDGADDDTWIADTGAMSHMTPCLAFFATYRSFCTPVRLADGNVMFSAGVGTVLYMLRLGGVDSRCAVKLTHVLHVLSLCCNLISVLFLVKHHDFVVQAQSNMITFKHNNQLLFTATISNHCSTTLNGNTLRDAPQHWWPSVCHS